MNENCSCDCIRKQDIIIKKHADWIDEVMNKYIKDIVKEVLRTVHGEMSKYESKYCVHANSSDTTTTKS